MKPKMKSSLKSLIQFLPMLLLGLGLSISTTCQAYDGGGSSNSKQGALGIMVGEPIGFSFTRLVTSGSSFEVVYGQSLIYDDTFFFYGTYVFSISKLLYSGFGAGFRFDGFGRVFARGPIGVRGFISANIDLYAEASIMIDVVSEIILRGGAVGGIRYYF